ncbi:hypothetical protein FJY68_07885 [candidate division WOR-3 bacterium]|uniref:Uncharacterized protein n=1 Tax=candidate division WOR-3 bacterium TaxID=2052148 RepID=A0A938BUB0_UNCW3|nr:hypothetical protein [candidate division WOR-3 bacterium]
MKIDGLDWMDWLHKVRHEAEAKRIRDGLTVEQWLQQVRVRAAESRERRRSHGYPSVARDKPPDGSQP